MTITDLPRETETGVRLINLAAGPRRHEEPYPAEVDDYLFWLLSPEDAALAWADLVEAVDNLTALELGDLPWQFYMPELADRADPHERAMNIACHAVDDAIRLLTTGDVDGVMR